MGQTFLPPPFLGHPSTHRVSSPSPSHQQQTPKTSSPQMGPPAPQAPGSGDGSRMESSLKQSYRRRGQLVSTPGGPNRSQEDPREVGVAHTPPAWLHQAFSERPSHPRRHASAFPSLESVLGRSSEVHARGAVRFVRTRSSAPPARPQSTRGSRETRTRGGSRLQHECSWRGPLAI